MKPQPSVPFSWGMEKISQHERAAVVRLCDQYDDAATLKEALGLA